jgi:hypothetical protein
LWKSSVLEALLLLSRMRVASGIPELPASWEEAVGEPATKVAEANGA